MNGFLATYRRELRAYFFSPLAYIVLFFFLMVNAFIFIYLVGELSNPASGGGTPFSYFFRASWLMLLLIIGGAAWAMFELYARLMRNVPKTDAALARGGETE